MNYSIFGKLVQGLQDFVRFLMEYLPEIVGGIIAGFLAALIYETVRRPNIDIKIVKDEWNPNFDIHTLHICVENKTRRYKIFPTKEAVDCSARILVFANDGEPLDGEFTLKWRGTDREQMTIYPGSEQWAFEKGKHLDVISKKKGETECTIEEVNLERREKLQEGIYYIKLALYYGGTKKIKWFRLSNNGTLPETVGSERDKYPDALKLEVLAKRPKNIRGR